MGFRHKIKGLAGKFSITTITLHYKVERHTGRQAGRRILNMRQADRQTQVDRHKGKLAGKHALIYTLYMCVCLHGWVGVVCMRACMCACLCDVTH